MRTIIAIALAFAALAHPAGAEQIWLTMDQVRSYELAKPAGQIVVGNPAVADVTVQDKQHVFLFGKAPGMTNMYVLDADGEFLDNLVIRVRATGSGMLVMHRGVERTTYNCTDNCDPTITVGDETGAFSTLQQQVTNKAEQARASGSE
jgi:Flp pilus assembly secretin CpaC